MQHNTVRHTKPRNEQLRHLCEVIQSDTRQFKMFPSKDRIRACVNRSRGILFAETLKVGEKYDIIGAQYFSENSLGANNELISDPPTPPTFSSPLQRIAVSTVEPSLSTDDLIRVVMSLRNESNSQMIEKNGKLNEPKESF